MTNVHVPKIAQLQSKVTLINNKGGRFVISHYRHPSRPVEWVHQWIMCPADKWESEGAQQFSGSRRALIPGQLEESLVFLHNKGWKITEYGS
jgi:hypothetical protein